MSFLPQPARDFAPFPWEKLLPSYHLFAPFNFQKAATKLLPAALSSSVGGLKLRLLKHSTVLRKKSQHVAVGCSCHYAWCLQPYPLHLISTAPQSREEKHSDPPKHAGVEIREITLPQQKLQVKKKKKNQRARSVAESPDTREPGKHGSSK